MHMDQLRYFMLVYETGSFALAGKMIPLSPQGVNRAVRALERELRKPLFAETTLKPTSYADALYAFAHCVSEGRDELMLAFDAIDAAESNLVRVGFSLGTLDTLGSDVFDAFKEQNPSVDFYFEEVVDEKCDENLEHGIYDLAITVAPVPAQIDGIELLSIPMTLWVNVRDPLSEKDVIRVADLEGRCVATPTPGAKNVDRLLARLSQEGVAPKKVVHFLQMFKIYEFVKNGEGMGTHIEGIIESSLFTDDQVRRVPFDDFRYTLSISWAKNHELTDTEQSFVRYVRSLKKLARIRRRAEEAAASR